MSPSPRSPRPTLLRRALSTAGKVALAAGAALLIAPPSDALPQRRRGRPAAPKAPANGAAKPVALVVLMENGGIEANLEACLGKSSSSRKIKVATAGSVSIPIPSEKNLPAALKNAATALAHLSAPIAPSRWTVETITLDEWVRRTSDLLLEELVKGFQAKSGIRSLYAKVVILEDEQLTPARAVQTICDLGKTHRVDVHTLVHGRNNEFIGGNHLPFGRANFFDPIKASGVDIRAVYQMNCVSGSLIDEWLEVGADVVNGTLGTKNNYMPHQYFHFQEHWTRGRSFGNAITQSYANARDYSEPAYETVGLIEYIEDSRMRVAGATGLTAKPTLLAVAMPIAANAVKTVAELAADLKAAGKSMKEALEALLADGCDVAEAAAAVASCYAAEGSDLATALIQAGVDAATAINACRQNAIKTSYGKIVKGLKAGGASASSIAKALKDRGKSAASVCDWLTGAGFSAASVVKTLRKDMKCSVATIVKLLKNANVSFQKIAKATWNDIKGRTPNSKIPAALSNLIQVMATEFSYSVVYVGGELAKLGIK